MLIELVGKDEVELIMQQFSEIRSDCSCEHGDAFKDCLIGRRVLLCTLDWCKTTKNLVEILNLPPLNKGFPDVRHNIGHKALHLTVDRESNRSYGLKY